jgi:hypothetical protein
MMRHNDVAWDFEDEIAEEERSQREPEVGSRELQIAPHRQASKADVDAIDVSENVGQDRERQQAQVDLAHGRLFDRSVHSEPPINSMTCELLHVAPSIS